MPTTPATNPLFIEARSTPVVTQFDSSAQNISELQRQYDEGNWINRILGFLASLLLTILGAWNFVGHFFKGHMYYACLDIYIALGGLLLALLEYKERLLPKTWVDAVKRETLFLARPYGRAILYIFLGFVMACEGGLKILFGVFVVVVGIVIVIGSYNNYQLLYEAKAIQFHDATLEKVMVV